MNYGEYSEYVRRMQEDGCTCRFDLRSGEITRLFSNNRLCALHDSRADKRTPEGEAAYLTEISRQVAEARASEKRRRKEMARKAMSKLSFAEKEAPKKNGFGALCESLRRYCKEALGLLRK